jgi:hypothetical protein
MTTAMIKATVNTMLVSDSESAIELADRVQNRTFWTYVAVLVVAALVTAFFTIKLWQSTGKYHEAVRADAVARIAEANERTRNVELRVAEQQERAAKAERELLELKRTSLELKQHAKDRHLATTQRAQLIKLLLAKPGGFVHMQCSVSEREAHDFGLEIGEAINEARDAGWKARCCDRLRFTPPVVGLTIRVRSLKDVPAYVTELQRALRLVGLPAVIEPLRSEDQPEGQMLLIVGTKRPP